jgi:hypothetical protein
MQISGQCHCGKISFTALIDPSRVIACHCADCQTFSGGPFRAAAPVVVENVSLQGTPRHYIKTAQSGNKRAQAFCSDCGTHLYATEPDQAKVLNLRVGCIKERAQLIPSAHIWGQSMQPWVTSIAKQAMHLQGPNSPLIHDDL